jgi:hypothetical protein
VIVEERIYTLQVGAVPEYVRLYHGEGLAIQEPILGHLVGYYTTELGPLNQVVHLWAYQDLEDRRERRARLLADERWREYVRKVQPLLITQENKILIPAPFAPPPRIEVQHGG